MAKIAKIPLVMKNGAKATDMKSLINNFDLESVICYFLNGKLLKWLNDRYYENEAEAIAHLSKEDPCFARKLCDIFGVQCQERADIDTEEILRRNQRISRLKQLTDDVDALSNIDAVAFDQEELADLYEQGMQKIFLCDGDFHIPPSMQHLEYILLGDAVVAGLIVPQPTRATECIVEDFPSPEQEESEPSAERDVLSGSLNSFLDNWSNMVADAIAKADRYVEELEREDEERRARIRAKMQEEDDVE